MKINTINKILFLIQLPPPVHGAAAMNKIVIESFDTCSYIRNTTISLNFSKSLDDLKKPSFYKFSVLFKIIFKLLFQLIFNRPKLVYLTLTPTGTSFLRDCLFVFVIKLFRIPLLYHLHGKGISQYAKKSIIAKHLYGFVFHNTKVILLAPELYHDISSYVDFDDVVIIPNGINCQGQVSEKHIKSNSIRFCFLSNLVKDKGILDFLDAFKNLCNNYNYIEAVVIGGYRSDGTEELVNEIITNMKGNISSRIKFTGQLYGEEKINALNNSDVFVFPTYIDTFPLVLIEAMANGLPCIVYDEGATRSMVKDNYSGFVVPKGECDLLTKAMEKLIKQPQLLYNMSVNSRARYDAKYTQDMFEKSIFKTINKLIN